MDHIKCVSSSLTSYNLKFQGLVNLRKDTTEMFPNAFIQSYKEYKKYCSIKWIEHSAPTKVLLFLSCHTVGRAAFQGTNGLLGQETYYVNQIRVIISCLRLKHLSQASLL